MIRREVTVEHDESLDQVHPERRQRDGARGQHVLQRAEWSGPVGLADGPAQRVEDLGTDRGLTVRREPRSGRWSRGWRQTAARARRRVAIHVRRRARSALTAVVCWFEVASTSTSATSSAASASQRRRGARPDGRAGGLQIFAFSRGIQLGKPSGNASALVLIFVRQPGDPAHQRDRLHFGVLHRTASRRRPRA